MLTIRGGVATWEREIMLERQREGIAKTKQEKYRGAPTDSACEGRRSEKAGRRRNED
jgi:DNA invertase Pin-like site-specific DNA recombinase